MLAINYRTRTFMVDKTAKILYNKGVHAARAGLFREAISYYKSALKLDPLFRQAFINLGSLYIRGKKYDRAKKCLLKAYQLGEDTDLYFNLASLEYKLGNDSKTVMMLENLLKHDSSHVHAHMLLAQIDENKGRASAAEEHLLAVLKLQPENTKALGAMALFCHERGREKEALDYLNRLLDLNPDNKKMQEIRASLNLKSNKLASALADYKNLAAEDERFVSFTETLTSIKEEDTEAFAGIEDKISEKTQTINARLKEIKEQGDQVDKDTLKEVLDLSFYHLFNGNSDDGLKYLFAAKKLGNDTKKN